jgi:hypothetical protein
MDLLLAELGLFVLLCSSITEFCEGYVQCRHRSTAIGQACTAVACWRLIGE